MGKTKKTPPQDEKQKKISSFFQGNAAPSSKNLFTTLGSKASNSKLSLKNNGSKTQVTKTEVRTDDPPEKSKQSSKSIPTDVTQCENKETNISRDNLSCHGQVEHYPNIIPETQIFKSPGMIKYNDNKKDENSDIDIIPDTPEDSMKVEWQKNKKVFGRSYLTAASAIGKKPGLTKMQIIQKKRLSRARKSLVSLSVNFNTSASNVDKEHDAKESEKIEILSLGENEVDDYVSGDNDKIPFKSGEDDKYSDQSDNSSTEKLEQNDYCNGLSIKKSPAPTEKTPTKIYDGSLKRMSKSGLSPESKRIMEETYINNSKNLHDVSSNKAIRNLTKCDSFERRRKIKPNVSAVNCYQLTMSRPKHCEQNVISSADDNVLGELLNELNANSKSTSSDVPLTDLRLKSRKSFIHESKMLPGLQVNDLTKFSVASEEELQYFNELDNDVHASVSMDAEKNCKDSGIKYTETIHMNAEENMDFKTSDYPAKCNRVTSSNISPTQNIKEFVTQDIVALKHEQNRQDIEDFPSQAEFTTDDLLCTDFDSMSPFKTNNSHKEDADFQVPVCLKYGRHVVLEKEHRKDDLVLHVKDYSTEEKKTSILSGFWTDIHVEEGDIVHLLGKFDSDGICRITDKDGLIIVNPDLLISGTTVVSSLFCMRKSILNEKFKGCDKGNIQMLYGSIIHAVFQQVLRKKLYEEKQILNDAGTIMKQNKFLHEMYGQSVTDLQVMEEVKKYIPPLQKWLEKYTLNTPNNVGVKSKSDSNITITKVRDIEENIWSPRFGVKGKIDLTVDIKLNKTQKKTVPLELKTGRASFSMEHKGQVTLYSMMSSDRRDDPKQGLLLYLKEADMKMIPVDQLHMKGVLQLRNEMAYYLNRQVEKTVDNDNIVYTLGRLPDVINNPRACPKCPQLLNCALYQNCVEKRQMGEGHSMHKLVPDTLYHLPASHMDYFTHWCLLLDLENKTNMQSGNMKDIWCKTGPQREKKGDCISHLTFHLSEMQNITEEDQVFIHFKRKSGKSYPALKIIGLQRHDYVIVSAENSDLIAVCAGSVAKISDDEVVLLTERESLLRLTDLKNHLFRVDKYDSYNTSAMFYSNLSHLLVDEPIRLRELIIDRKKPKFVLKMSKGEIEKVKEIFKPLNKPQKTAILKVLMSKDYVLIKGYPGTGKTSTIVSLVKVLVLLGYSVLLTSYTHSAVDNILLKLLKKNIKFVRLGRLSKIHLDVQQCAAEKLTQHLSSVGELRDFYSFQKVIATTALGMNHSVFSQRRFDVCIMDEASQILQPASLGPLFCADKFVLVGDPKQLPPVVQSKEARNLGMDESLFMRLDNGCATFELNMQYRMNKDIMYLSNSLVYDGALKCGNDSVANSMLSFPDPHIVHQVMEKFDWMTGVLAAEPYKAAVFLDTKLVPAPEVRDGSGLIKNKVEAEIVRCIVESYRQLGIHSREIGVIAPYRKQVSLICETLSCFQDVEVNTVDQYQGRDKDLIIISLTRSFTSKAGTENQSGELLKDIRRLNVAITRAKKKLILVGDVETMLSYPPLSSMISLMKKGDHIITLPTEAYLSFNRSNKRI